MRRRIVAGEPIEAAVLAEAGTVVDDAVLASLRRDTAAEIGGAGPLEPLLALPGVTDVLVNSAEEVWLDRGRGLERAAIRFPNDLAVRSLAQRLAASTGRRLDDASPYVDAGLPDGTRLHAILPPLVEHPTICLRVLARRRLALDQLQLPSEVVGLLRRVIADRQAFLISGGTGSGKTTLLAAMLSEASASERLVTIEDAPELAILHPHVVRMIPRAANVEGAGAIGLRELVRNALRMRPDRLVVGEFRGAEMVELLVALNTGHDGGAATLHANSAADVPARLRALGLLGAVTAEAVTALVVSAIDLVIHLRRRADGIREVAELARVVARGDQLGVDSVWRPGTVPGGAS